MRRNNGKGAMRAYKNCIMAGIIGVVAALAVAVPASATSQHQSRAVIQQAVHKYSDAYGKNVGRWIPVADEVGWTRDHWRTLMYIVYRESRGIPTAYNKSSGAAGLLQFMPQWYKGMWGLPPFDPFNGRTNLRMGLKLHKTQGWSPWAM